MNLAEDVHKKTHNGQIENGTKALKFVGTVVSGANCTDPGPPLDAWARSAVRWAKNS